MEAQDPSAAVFPHPVFAALLTGYILFSPQFPCFSSVRDSKYTGVQGQYLANVMGFVGAALALLLLFWLCLRTLRTAMQSADALGRLICVGIFAALFVQCVINLGMNLQVLPVIGVTLPFFSAGGSSVVMMYLCVGLVLSVGMHARTSRLQARPIL